MSASEPPALADSAGADARDPDRIASLAFDSFMRRYWDPKLRFFYARSDHSNAGRNHIRPGEGHYSDFWWEAQLWDLVIDEAERTRSTEAIAMVHRVYDGFVAQFPDFGSDYNDDRGWWALASTRAFELTHNRRYLHRAEQLLDGILGQRDGTYGGGIWWRRSVRDQKNVATNAPAVETAIRLCRMTGDQRYCDAAGSLFGWLDRSIRDGDRILDHIEGPGDGRLVDWQFTYNYGTYLGAATHLYRLTGDEKYRDKAIQAGEKAIAVLAPDGILHPEGRGDAGGFRGIFVRNLAFAARQLHRQDFLDFLGRNADAAWAARQEDGLIGESWTSRATGVIESLTAQSGVAVIQAAADADRRTP